MRGTTLLALSAWAAHGCTGTIVTGNGGDGVDDFDPPALEVQTPDRGNITQDETLVVSGVATDTVTGVASVTVDGVDAELDGSGHFTAEIPLVPGINVVHIVATDRAGNMVDDYRATMAGEFRRIGTPIEDAAALRINNETLSAISSLLSGLIMDTDIGAALATKNPVITSGSGCLSVSVDVNAADKSAVNGSMSLVEDGLAFEINIEDAVIDLSTDYSLLCATGQADLRLTADRLAMSGVLRLSLDNDEVVVSLENVEAEIVNFVLTSPTLPQEILDLIASALESDGAKEALTTVIEQIAPQEVEKFLRDAVERGITFMVKEQEITVRIDPTEIDLKESGGSLILNTAVSFTDTAGDYPYSPMPLPTAIAEEYGLDVIIADDLFNQILSGFWAARVFHMNIEAPVDGVIKATFGDEADYVKVEPLLPPLMTFDRETGIAIVQVGDIMVTIQDDDDGLGPMAEFVASGEMEVFLNIADDGSMSVSAGEVTPWAKVLGQSDAVIIPLDDAKANAFSEPVVDLIADEINEVLDMIPIPGPTNLQVTGPDVKADAGYMQVCANLQAD